MAGITTDSGRRTPSCARTAGGSRSSTRSDERVRARAFQQAGNVAREIAACDRVDRQGSGAMRTNFERLAIVAIVGAACGGSNTPAGSAEEGGTGGSLSTTSPVTAEDTGVAETSGGASNTAGTMSGTADTTGAAQTSSDGGEGVHWDVGAIPDTPEIPCSKGDGKGGGDEPEWSYLWASNSAQGTISKIDTQTVTEVGRFITRPDGIGDPSRTSVSQSGHVAVANRSGGVTKIYADISFCDDSNGTPGIQTS